MKPKQSEIVLDDPKLPSPAESEQAKFVRLWFEAYPITWGCPYAQSNMGRDSKALHDFFQGSPDITADMLFDVVAKAWETPGYYWCRHAVTIRNVCAHFNEISAEVNPPRRVEKRYVGDF